MYCIKIFLHFMQLYWRYLFLLFHLDLFWKHPNSKERVAELTQWLKNADFAKAERQPCGTKALGEAVVSRLVEEVDKVATVRARVVKMQVRPHLLFKVCSSLSFDMIM